MIKEANLKPEGVLDLIDRKDQNKTPNIENISELYRDRVRCNGGGRWVKYTVYDVFWGEEGYHPETAEDLYPSTAIVIEDDVLGRSSLLISERSKVEEGVCDMVDRMCGTLCHGGAECIKKKSFRLE
ncbi:hypothetical protein HY333_01720 [Candidatus Collierbacteria bacterium]|nr:hypothetical protein [Candidatus Collierbacteria bacterium]